jgi:hypothetical protein
MLWKRRGHLLYLAKPPSYHRTKAPSFYPTTLPRLHFLLLELPRDPKGDKKPAAQPSAVSSTHETLEDPPALDHNQTTMTQFFAVTSINHPRVQPRVQPATTLVTVSPSHAKYNEICNTLGSWAAHPHIPSTTWLDSFKEWGSIVTEVDDKGFLPDFESCDESKSLHIGLINVR